MRYSKVQQIATITGTTAAMNFQVPSALETPEAHAKHWTRLGRGVAPTAPAGQQHCISMAQADIGDCCIPDVSPLLKNASRPSVGGTETAK